MPVLLRIDSSASGSDSVSRRLTDAFTAAWLARGADHTVVARDLHEDAVPHLPHSSLHWPAAMRDADAPRFPEAEARQQAFLAELIGADVVVIGAPLYNYSVPSTLKAWIDHIHVPGVTAPFGDEPSQPLRGRTAVVVSSRGATYDAGTPSESWDHGIPPLSIVLGNALGMRVETVAVSRTLSTTLPSMAGERPAFEQEYAAAELALRRLAETL